MADPVPARWSTNVSDVESLPLETQRYLEDYIRLSRIGHFDKAEELFESSLEAKSAMHGVVLVERAEALRYEFRWGALSAFLRTAVPAQGLNQPQKEYLKFMGRLADIYTYGSLQPALEAARSIESRLRNKSWQELSVYEVHLVELYVRVITVVDVNSNWIDPDEKQHPTTLTKSESAREPWSDSIAWLDELSRRGLWWSARRFLKLINRQLSPEKVVTAYTHLLKQLEGLEDGSEATRYTLGSTRICFFWSTERKDSCTSSQRLSVLDKAAAELGYAGAVDNQLYPRTYMEWRLAKASLLDDVKEKTRAWQSLADEAQGSKDSQMEYQARYNLLAEAPGVLEHVQQRQHATRLRHIDSVVQPDVTHLMNAMMKTWALGGDEQLALLNRALDEFDRSHPTLTDTTGAGDRVTVADGNPDSLRILDAPLPLYQKYTMQHLIRKRLNLPGIEDMARLEKRALEGVNTAMVKEVKKSFFARDWYGQDVHDIFVAMSILLRWMKDSADRQTLTLEGLRGVLQKPEASLSELASLDMRSLGGRLYVEAASETEWRQRLPAMERWIERDRVHAGVDAEWLISQLLHHRTKNLPTKGLSITTIKSNMSKLGDYAAYVERCDQQVRDSQVRLWLDVRLYILYHHCLLWTNKGSNSEILTAARADCLKIIDDCKNPAFNALSSQLAKSYMRLADIDGILIQLVQLDYLFAEQMRSFQEADVVFEKLRSELSILGGDAAFEAKRSWGSVQHDSRFLVTRALAALLEQHQRSENVGDGFAQQMWAQEIWQWVQKSKARALADMLGLENELPAELKERVEQDRDASAKLRLWRAKKTALSGSRDSGQADLIDASAEADELERDMRETPILKEILDLAQGRAVTLKDMMATLNTLANDQGKRVVLVDWFKVYPFPDAPYHLILVRHDGKPKLFALDQALNAQVQAWVGKYLSGQVAEGEQGDPWCTAFEDLQQLRALVQPLKEHTSEDDILVFCPTGILHRLPLHALELEGSGGSTRVPSAAQTASPEAVSSMKSEAKEMLLRRNKILYTESMSIFRYCVSSGQAHSKATPSTKPAVGTPLGSGIPSVELVANAFHADIIAIEEYSRSEIISDWTDADFAYFFGHVHDLGDGKQLQSHLLLAVQSEAEEKDTCSGTHDPDSQLTVQDILRSVRFRKGAHACLIACESGVQYAAPGDEVQGLIPALFFAGARSATTTLWSINPRKAQEWTTSFIEQWQNLQASDAAEDLSECVRRASLAMLDNTGVEHMEDWAPYISHGWSSVHAVYKSLLNVRTVVDPE